MSNDIPEKMRQEVKNLLAKSAATFDEAEKRRLASHAFALAQMAEAGERSRQGGEKKQQATYDIGADANLKLVAKNNLTRFLGCLYGETDRVQRELYWSLLLREVQWFAAKEERVEMLQSLLRDCDGHMQRHKAGLGGQEAAGVDVTQTEALMTNLFEIQTLLRDSIQNELRRG